MKTNLLWRVGALARPAAVAGLMALAVPCSAVVLFEDNFDSGSLSPAWVSKMCCQWVEDGWMHTRGGDGKGRDSLAIVHDADPGWRNYKVSMQAQFVDTGFVDQLSVVLRTDDYLISSGPRSGQAYELGINGPRGWGGAGEANHIVFGREDFRPGATSEWFPLGDKHIAVPTTPMLIEASLVDGHIQIWMDHKKIFDVIDPDPLTAGGVGVRAIWEVESRFDNVRVSAIPEPSALWTAGLGLAAIGGVMRRRSAG